DRLARTVHAVHGRSVTGDVVVSAVEGVPRLPGPGRRGGHGVVEGGAVAAGGGPGVLGDEERQVRADLRPVAVTTHLEHAGGHRDQRVGAALLPATGVIGCGLAHDGVQGGVDHG